MELHLSRAALFSTLARRRRTAGKGAHIGGFLRIAWHVTPMATAMTRHVADLCSKLQQVFARIFEPQSPPHFLRSRDNFLDYHHSNRRGRAAFGLHLAALRSLSAGDAPEGC